MSFGSCREMLQSMHLFAGAGGGLLADLILGHRPVVAVEWDKHACRALRERAAEGWFPGLHVHEGDIRMFDPSEYAGIVDVIHAGFPCQDISAAGKGAGIEGARSGLYREAIRAIGIVRPRWVMLENSPAIRTRGRSVVIRDLVAIGYSYRDGTLAAADVGAPHRRNRWWLLANLDVADGVRFQGVEGPRGAAQQKLPAVAGRGYVAYANGSVRNGRPDQPRRGQEGGIAVGGDGEDVAYTTRNGRQQRRAESAGRQGVLEDVERGGDVEDSERERSGPENLGSEIDRTETDRSTSRAGGPGWWQSEPDVGGNIDGLASWLDGHQKMIFESHKRIIAHVIREYGALCDETRERARKVLRELRNRAETEEVWSQTGGHERISPEEVLLAYLRKLEERAADETWLQLAGQETLEERVRGVRSRNEPDSAPHRPGQGQQLAGKHPDPLQTLSRLLARDAEKAWSAYRLENAAPILTGWQAGWEDGFSRLANGVTNRVDRLRCIGNGQVPLQAAAAWALLGGPMT